MEQYYVNGMLVRVDYAHVARAVKAIRARWANESKLMLRRDNVVRLTQCA